MSIIPPPPGKLPDHSVSEYKHTNIFSSTSEFMFVSSYYHDGKERQFPIGMHKHSFYEINIIVSGEGYHYIENSRFAAKTGSVYVIPPNVRHGYWTANDDDFIIFHLLISLAFIERYKQELASIPKYLTLFEIEPFLRMESNESLFLVLDEEQLETLQRDYFRYLVALEELPPNQVNIIKIGKTLSLIGVLAEIMAVQHHDVVTVKSSSSANSFMIAYTMEYMKKNYFNKITIDDLARMANMARTTYLKQFKTFCKKTPYNYLTEVRIERAAALLQYKDDSITRISQDCGFFDSSHFSKAFKSIKKCSPLNYRKKYRSATKN